MSKLPQSKQFKANLWGIVIVVVALGLLGVFLIYRSHAASADINGDGSVNNADLAILKANFGGSGKTFAQGDISGDGKVNSIDLALLALAWGSGSPGTPEPYQASGNTDKLPQNLIFDDEFDGTGLDTKTWVPVWFSNGSIQNGTKMEASNVGVSGGYLHLLNSGGAGGQGGLVSTNPTTSNGQSGYHGFQYSLGYAEARICLTAAPGGSIANWPAWWTDGQNWPGDGEQDIMEGLSGNAAAHWHGSISGNGGAGYGNAGHLTGCHIFASLWKAGTVTSYYDGSKLGSYSSSEVVTNPEYLILENSTGSSGGPEVDGVDIKVDYVRVWQ